MTGLCHSENWKWVISLSCFVVGGIQSLSVDSDGGILTLGIGRGSAKLFVPSGAIPRRTGATDQVCSIPGWDVLHPKWL